MQNTVKLKIKTLSNLFIGGAPIPFEIGGIDQQTVLDQEDFPIIPGSSLKGALRAIVRRDNSDTSREILQLYSIYLKEEKKANWMRIKELVHEEEALKKIEDRYDIAAKNSSAEYLFGIEGFNNTPKLLFSDLVLCDEFRDKKSCFSIDMKNSLDTGGDVPVSNPRTYKAARGGLFFAGEIQLYKMELLNKNAEELCKRYLKDTLLKFNNGIFRLGNSKSRGYGKVEVSIENESEALKI